MRSQYNIFLHIIRPDIKSDFMGIPFIQLPINLAQFWDCSFSLLNIKFYFFSIAIKWSNLAKSAIEKYPSRNPCNVSIIKYIKNNLLTKVKLAILNIWTDIMPDKMAPKKVKKLKNCNIIVLVQKWILPVTFLCHFYI